MAFISMLVIMTVCETVWAKRERSIDRLMRWPGNLGIAMLGTVVVRLIFPVTAAGVALLAQTNGIGLFNALMPSPVISIPLSLLLLDMTIYGQHRLFHSVPLLWRIHRMHHTDLDIDVSTGLRFHLAKLLLSMLIKFAAIIAIGAPPLAVLIFEIGLNACSLFNHANVRLPEKLDNFLRTVIVTPDMHRVHHSTLPSETNSNYGFGLSWWDKAFGTYVPQPKLGHTGMIIGLENYREPDVVRLDHMLVNPFRQ